MGARVPLVCLLSSLLSVSVLIGLVSTVLVCKK